MGTRESGTSGETSEGKKAGPCRQRYLVMREGGKGVYETRKRERGMKARVWVEEPPRGEDKQRA